MVLSSVLPIMHMILQNMNTHYLVLYQCEPAYYAYDIAGIY